MLNLKNYGEKVKNDPYSYLAHFGSKVIRSQQLGLGVGGFRPWKVLKDGGILIVSS